MCLELALIKNDAIMSKRNLAEWSLSLQRCNCVIVDVMELFFLGFMAPGWELAHFCGG